MKDKSMKKIYFILSCLILVIFTSCISLKITDTSALFPVDSESKKVKGISYSLFGFEFGEPNKVVCEGGIASIEMKRGGLGILLDFLQGYMILPGTATTRANTTVCAILPPPPPKIEDPNSDYKDILTLKNGDILTNIKVILNENTLTIEFPDGTKSELQKKEVLSMKKGK